MYRRQDLAYLKEIASVDGGRKPLSALAPPDAVTMKMMRETFIQAYGDLAVSTVKEHDWPLPKHPDEAVPLCTLRYGELPVRPVGNKAKGNAVETSRMFGGHRIPMREIRALLPALGSDIVSKALVTKVYTRGTVEGFENRLKLLKGDTVKSIFQSEGFPKSQSARMAHLERLLPVQHDLLPDWNGGESGDLIDMLKKHVKVTAKASAGAPYWRAKGEVMPMVFHVLEYVVGYLKDGKLDELLKEQPELFLIEGKNKEDRYEKDKLLTKTRPYFNPPAHWNLLASFLHQAMSHALYKVGDGVPTWNAYGWSAAHGGIARLVADVRRRFKAGERGWGYVYGDDGDLYFVAKGRLYRVSPDVKQMDSCVDFDTLRLTYDYILHSFSRVYGPNNFWSTVVKALLALLEKPRILISGTQLYTKPADGLLSGVVGTTLFDTVKSAVAYSSLMEAHSHNPALLLNAEHVAKWMLDNHGLVIKEGTWEPEVMDLEVEPCMMRVDGTLIDPHMSLYGTGKFLGVQYVKVAGPVHEDWVPFLPDEDWASAILAPRDSWLDVSLSATAKERLAFDRARGYLTTGAIFSDAVRSALFFWIDSLASEAILMQPHGTEPPEGILFGTDVEWEYPTPEFVPSLKWVWDIYATEGNTFGEPAPSMFSAEVLEQISEMRAEDRRIRISVRDGATYVEPYVPLDPELPTILPQALAVHTPKLDSCWEGPTPERAKVPSQRVALPETQGVPRDLLKPQQTDEAARLEDVRRRPRDTLMAQLVSGEVKPLVDVSRAIEGEVVEVPPSMIAREVDIPLAHPPTKRGLLPPIAGPSPKPVLVRDSFPRLRVVTSLPPLPAGAVNRILQVNGYLYKFVTRVSFEYQGEGPNRVSKACVEVTVQFAKELSGKAASEWKEVQVWKASSLAAFKPAFWAYVLARNKAGWRPTVDKHAALDWSLGADRKKVPYSEFDAIPPPPQFADNPLDPIPVLIERRSGTVDVLATTEEPPVVVGRPEPMPISEVPMIPTEAPYSVLKGPVLPPKPAIVKKYQPRWWETSSDEEDVKGGFENVYFDWKTKRFLPRPEFGAPPVPPRRGQRKEKKHEEDKAEEHAASPESSPDSGLELKETAVVEELKEESTESLPLRKGIKPLPPVPEGGWPYYLLKPRRAVRVCDLAKRDAFTKEFGCLPSRRGLQAKEVDSKRVLEGGSPPAVGTVGANPIDLSSVPTSVLERIVKDRKYGSQDKKKRGESEGGRGGVSQEKAAEKEISPYTSQPYVRPRFHRGGRKSSPRKSYTRARY